MNNPKQRVPFGQETRLAILSSICPGCDAKSGCYHDYGCPLESCPECGGRLLKCSCKALDIVDGMRVANAVAKTITDKAEIHRVLNYGSKHLDATYYEEGVLSWIIQDVTERDPEAVTKMEKHMAGMGFRKSGDGYVVSAEDIAPHMEVSIDEAHEVLEKLQVDSTYPHWDKHTGVEQ